MGLHEQALLRSPGRVCMSQFWGHLGTQGLWVHWRMETALLLKHTREHPLQVQVKVRDECKPVFCAHGRQEPLKESGATLEHGPLAQRRVPSAATATLLPGAHGKEVSTPLLNWTPF